MKFLAQFAHEIETEETVGTGDEGLARHLWRSLISVAGAAGATSL